MAKASFHSTTSISAMVKSVRFKIALVLSRAPSGLNWGFPAQGMILWILNGPFSLDMYTKAAPSWVKQALPAFVIEFLPNNGFILDRSFSFIFGLIHSSTHSFPSIKKGIIYDCKNELSKALVALWWLPIIYGYNSSLVILYLWMVLSAPSNIAKGDRSWGVNWATLYKPSRSSSVA